MSIVRESRCVHCGNVVRTYKRKFNQGMAMTLLCMRRWQLLHRPPDGWMNLNRLEGFGGFNPSQSRENGRIAMWGLIEEKPNEATGKRTSGCWRLTQAGFQFTGNALVISECVVETNNQWEKYEGKAVTIADCLANGMQFSYPELMQRMWDEGAR